MSKKSQKLNYAACSQKIACHNVTRNEVNFDITNELVENIFYEYFESFV